jgi:4'-phosphopantetheinyl transferase
MLDMSDGAVHLWFAFPEEWQDSTPAPLTLDILAADEIARMERLRSRENRRLYGVSHWLVRMALSHYEGRPPGAWRFIANAYGKPMIDPASGPSPLTFSLAHTRGLAVVAVTKGSAVGADVERTDRKVDAQGLVHRFFATEEAQALEELPTESLADRFFLYWTLKEAGLKALGTGFSLPLSTFAFRLTAGRPRRITVAGAPPPGGETLHWAAIAPRPPYMAALGVESGPGKTVRLHCYQATPSGQAAPLACEPIALSEGVVCEPPVLASGVGAGG